jgi:hypothetical protein
MNTSPAYRDNILDFFTGITPSTSLYLANCTLKFYTGSPPVNVTDTPTGTLLATVTPGGTNTWAPSIGGVAQLIQPYLFAGTVGGVAGYVLLQNATTNLAHFTVGVAGSGADIILGSTTISTAANANQIQALDLKLPFSLGASYMNIDLVDALVDEFARGTGVTPNMGSNSATVSIYTGSSPASANEPPTGTLLATAAFPTQGFSPSSGGVAVLSVSKQTAAAVGAGTPGYASWEKGGGGARLYAPVGTSGAAITIDRATVAVGEVVTILDMTVSF